MTGCSSERTERLEGRPRRSTRALPPGGGLPSRRSSGSPAALRVVRCRRLSSYRRPAHRRARHCSSGPTLVLLRRRRGLHLLQTPQSYCATLVTPVTVTPSAAPRRDEATAARGTIFWASAERPWARRGRGDGPSGRVGGVGVSWTTSHGESAARGSAETATSKAARRRAAKCARGRACSGGGPGTRGVLAREMKTSPRIPAGQRLGAVITRTHRRASRPDLTSGRPPH